MASSAGVSPATLRHYFGDREGAIAAALNFAREGGQPHLDAVMSGDIGDIEETLLTLMRMFILGWQHYGLGNLQRSGLAIGLNKDELGQVYLNSTLEPVFQAFEVRLKNEMLAGRLGELDPRHASLQLVSPVFLALIHQDALGGETCRPLCINTFLRDHLERFLRAHAPDS